MHQIVRPSMVGIGLLLVEAGAVVINCGRQYLEALYDLQIEKRYLADSRYRVIGGGIHIGRCRIDPVLTVDLGAVPRIDNYVRGSGACSTD
jgi:hypothetical protein